jgi:uncharacterized membrane protein YcaP (DUF421 family)
MIYFARALYYAVLLAGTARLLNRRVTASDLPYDFAVNVTYGTVAGGAVLTRSISLPDGTLAIAGLTLFVWVVEKAAARWPAVHRLAAGRPTPLIRDGRVVTESLRQVHMTEADLRGKLRELKVAAVADVALAEMETDGRIGLIMRQDATKRDRRAHGARQNRSDGPGKD